jgi:hypothetical protein
MTATSDVTSLVPLWRDERLREERARLAKYERELSYCNPTGPYAESMRLMVALQRDVVEVVERHGGLPSLTAPPAAPDGARAVK